MISHQKKSKMLTTVICNGHTDTAITFFQLLGYSIQSENPLISN